jgi:hypothetical protein
MSQARPLATKREIVERLNNKLTIRPRISGTVSEIRIMSGTDFVPNLLNILMKSEKTESIS